ncbi:TetR/AcrR family transcriptional regulator [Amycolatopsis sp. NBC_01480]|uniref:TetR/AcrR family transcriptional regulator n=1 Tax=Amycolatopsis sp. NBC_01480 TaxID=2903562 RepID=UPI002E28E958|nr:TetR/AcrR family transcriptional regulator [Amycolatopsis sp. NBC_01480]
MSEDTAAPARARNRRGEGARLRDEIVTAAAELLDETGDDSAISLRSVARRVGIAAPSIYRHFPDQPAIVLAVTQSAFAELDDRLRTGVAAAGENPRKQLFAICHGYLEFAAAHPGRYRTMFGGFWKPNPSESSVSETDLARLGEASMGLLAETLTACADAGLLTSTDPGADAVVLWLGLHGLAHQRAVSPAFRWPPDIAERLITRLARLDDE